MPNNGRVFDRPVVSFYLRAEAGGDYGATVSAQLTTSYATDAYGLAGGFGLYLTGDSKTDAWTAKYTGPHAPSGGYVVSGTGWADNSVEIRLKDAKLYEKITGSLWLLSCSAIEIWVNDALSITFGGVSETSSGSGPNYVPLIALPGCVTGDTTWSVTPPARPYSIFGGSHATLHGWYRFKESSGGPWIGHPMTVCPLAVPTIGGTTLGAFLPSYTLTNTASASISLYFYGGTTYTKYHSSPDYYHQFSLYQKNQATYYLLPDYDKEIIRMNDDYWSMWIRYGMPRTDGYAQHGTYRAYAGPGAVIEQHEIQPEIHPSQSQILSVVGNARHEIEDTFRYRSYCPLEMHADWRKTDVDDPADSGGSHTTPPPIQETISYVFPYTVEDYDTNGDILNANYHADATARYCAFWGHPHNSYKRWTGAGLWKVDGSPTAWADYWGKIREQFLYNAGLPTGEKRKTRNHIVFSHCQNDEGNGNFLDADWAGLRRIGLCRFKVYETNLQSSITLSPAKPGLWAARSVDDVADCSVSLGTDGITLSGFNANPAAVDLQFGNWSEKPFMLLYLAKKFAVSWATANVDSMQISLIGYDDEETVLGTAQRTYTIPAGNQAKYAGSHAIDNGAGETDTGTDSLGTGISSTIMGDPEGVLAFQLGTGRAFKALRFTVTPHDTTASVLIDWPTFELWDTHPSVYWENGKCAALVWPNGPGIRSGNWTFYNPILGWLYPPIVTGLDTESTIVDGLAFAHLVLRGDSGSTYLDDDITTELSGLYDSYEGQSIGVVDKFGNFRILPKGKDEKVRIALCNSFSGCEPLALFPVRKYDANWQQTGPFGQVTYDMVFEDRRIISPAAAPVKVTDGSGTFVGSSESGVPVGWSVWKYAPVLSLLGNDSGWHLKSGSDVLATIRPWHGFFVVPKGVAVEDGLDYAVSSNWRHAVIFRRANTAWLAFSSNVTPSYHEVDSGNNWSRCRVSYADGSESALWVLYRDSGGAFYLTKTKDEGGSFDMAISIGSGDYGDFCWSQNHVLHVYRLSGGTVYLKRFDLQGNAIGTEITTDLTGLNSKQFSCAPSVGSGGEHRIGLWHVVAGVQTIKTSVNGWNFV